MIPFAGIAEPVSSLTHLGGALLFLIGLAFLLPMVPGKRQRVFATVGYVVGVGGMLLASAAYHLLDVEHPARDVLRYLDHAMIWLAIAGHISLYLVFECPKLIHLQTGLWSIGLTGLVCEALFLRELAPWVSPLLYIGMGWFGVVPLVQIYRRRGLRFVVLPLAAGLFATTGGLVEAFEWPSFYPRVMEAHEVLHVFILLSMLTFEVSVYQCLRPLDRELLAELPAAQSPA